MNNITKGFLLTGGIMFVIGTGLFALGNALGGKSYIKTANLNKMDANAKFDEIATKSQEKTKIDPFANLKINLSQSDLIIKQSDDTNAYIAYHLEGNEKIKTLDYGVENNQLTIKETGKSSTFDSIQDNIHIDISFLNYFYGGSQRMDYTNTVTLYLPADTQIKNSDLTIDYGSLSLDNYHTDQMSLTLGYGELTTNHSNLKNANIKMSSGSATIKDTILTQTNIDCAYGDLAMTDGQYAGGSLTLGSGEMTTDNTVYNKTVNVNSSYGDVNIRLTEENIKAIGITADTSYGEIDLDDYLSAEGNISTPENDSDIQHYAKNGDGKSGELKIKAESGDVEIGLESLD